MAVSSQGMTGAAGGSMYYKLAVRNLSGLTCTGPATGELLLDGVKRLVKLPVHRPNPSPLSATPHVTGVV